jgi:predicted Zn-ribbon and HTH transcriptional regulator
VNGLTLFSGGEPQLAAIYQGTCKHCGYESAADADGALAVLIERDHAALEVPLNKSLVSYETGDLAAVESLCLLELAHPLEDSILHSTGLAFGEASRNGRLVSLQSVVCRECGMTFKRRKLIARTGAAGCFAGLAVCLIAGFTAGYLAGSFWIGFGAVYCALLVWWAADSAVQWWWLRRFRERGKLLARPRGCPSCGSDSVQSVTRSKPIACHACRQKSMTFKMVGIS